MDQINNNISLDLTVPKKIMKPKVFQSNSKELIREILEVGSDIFGKFIYKYDNERDTFPGYRETLIKKSLRILDEGVYVGVKDYNGNIEIRSFALISSAPVDILEVCINLIIGEVEDFPTILKKIIHLYNNSDYYNLYSYIPNNEIIKQIFLDLGFLQVDEFVGGLRNRIRYLKMNFRLTQHIYPPINIEEEKIFLTILDSLKNEHDEFNAR